MHMEGEGLLKCCRQVHQISQMAERTKSLSLNLIKLSSSTSYQVETDKPWTVWGKYFYSVKHNTLDKETNPTE